jgi:hypothetical protein
MRQTWKLHITSVSLEERMNLHSIDWYINTRRLKWIGQVMRMNFSERLPRKMITSWVNHSRPKGRPVLNYGQCLEHTLKETNFNSFLSTGNCIDLESWQTLAKDKCTWKKFLENV